MPPNKLGLDYWASVPSDQIGEKVRTKVEGYGSQKLVSSMRGQYSRAYEYYYGVDPSGIHATSTVLRGGDQGELAEMRVNHCRPLVNTLLNLIVAPKIVWTPKAVNIDYASLKACKLASAVLEYYWTEKRVAQFAVQALEEALFLTEGFVLLEWDDDGGEDHAADETGGIVKSGDVRFTNVSTWDVTRDTDKTSYEQLDWVIVSVRRNKYSLAAKYSQRHLQENPGDEYGAQRLVESILGHEDDAGRSAARQGGQEVSDDVVVDYLFHKRTPALPDGRAAIVLGDVMLEDGAMETDQWPLYRVAAAEMIGTPFAYAPFMEILGVQELMDSLHTSAATNLSTLGTQSITAEQGSEVNLEDVAGGMRVIYYPQGGKPPEALSLARTPAELYSYLESLKADQELLFGLNSVVRGQPESGEQSGSALALLQSQALQQSSTVQANYIRFVEGIGNGLMDLVRRKLNVAVKVAIAGKANQFLVEDTDYSGASFERIRKVQVEIGNPLAQTAAGRSEIGKDLMAQGFIKTAEQYLQVLETGRLEPLTQGLSNELLLIRSENEQLQRGEYPPALALDDHSLHAREHRAVLGNPEARRDQALIKAVLSHIMEHENLLYSTSPTTLMLVGQQPPPMPMGPVAPDGSPMAGPPPGPGGPPGDAGAAMAPPGNPDVGAAQAPSQPTNPATGQEWNPVDGGGAVPS